MKDRANWYLPIATLVFSLLLLCLPGLATADESAAAPAPDGSAAAATSQDTQVVDMADVVCPTARCGVAQGGRVVYTDDNHLASSFTRSVAPIVGARLDGAARSLGVRLP